MNHINLFQTVKEYESAKDTLLVPNVSYITDTDEVKFLKIHVVDFGVDAIAKSMCVSRWDTDGDGELSFAEAAAVTNISTIFKNATISDGMFLKKFTGITELPKEAFRFASSLTRVAVPANVTKWNTNVFGDATALREVYLYWTSSAWVHPSVIQNNPLPASVSKIYIPKGTMSIYAGSTSRFSSYASKLVELDKMP